MAGRRSQPDDRPRARAELRHAGRPRRRRARRTDRRGLAAHLPDLDLRPGRRRSAASRLRVRTLAEPDPRAARARGRRARGRRRTGSPSHRARRRPRPSPSWRRRATRSSSATTSTAARSGISSGSVAGPASIRSTSTSRPGLTSCGRRSPSGPAWSGSRRRRTPCSRSSTSTPSPRRSRAGRRRVAAGRWSSSTTRSRRRPSSGRSSVARTSSSTRRRSTWPATPTRSWGVAVTSDDAVAERLRFLQNAMGAVPGPARLLPRPARPAHAPSADGAPRDQRARRSRDRLRARPDVADVRYPGFGGHGLVHPVGGRRRRDGPLRNGRSPSPRAPACSRWPNRSAASSR